MKKSSTLRANHCLHCCECLVFFFFGIRMSSLERYLGSHLMPLNYFLAFLQKAPHDWVTAQ